MTNRVFVDVLSLPSQPETPTGPDKACSGKVTDYVSAGGEHADGYTLELSPAEAGTLLENGLEFCVEWNADYSGMAYISLRGPNDCGNGESSREFEVEDALHLAVFGPPNAKWTETNRITYPDELVLGHQE